MTTEGQREMTTEDQKGNEVRGLVAPESGPVLARDRGRWVRETAQFGETLAYKQTSWKGSD